jgi:hypothetical protein
MENLQPVTYNQKRTIVLMTLIYRNVEKQKGKSEIPKNKNPSLLGVTNLEENNYWSINTLFCRSQEFSTRPLQQPIRGPPSLFCTLELCLLVICLKNVNNILEKLSFMRNVTHLILVFNLGKSISHKWHVKRILMHVNINFSLRFSGINVASVV